MRKGLCLCLALCCLAGLTACVQSEENPQAPFACYYLQSELTYGEADSVIGCEYQEASGHESDYVWMLDRYLAGPESETLTSPFPRGTMLYGFEMVDASAYVDLSADFAELTGIALTVGCVCLTQTVIAMTGCEAVVISAEDSLLDGSKSITMTADSYLLLDSSAATESD